MKNFLQKWTGVLAALVLALCAVVSAGAAAYESGDVDGDSWVCIKDVTLIQKYAAGIEELGSSALWAADVNDDDTVDVDDATAIQKYIAGLTESLPEREQPTTEAATTSLSDSDGFNRLVVKP